MENKRGILGAIFGAIIIIIALIGFLVYSQIKSNGLTLSTGDVTIKIDYNKSENKQQIQNNTPIINNRNINETWINESFEEVNTPLILIEEVNTQQ